MSLGKETAKHAVIYSAASVIGRLVSFFMLPFYAHLLEREGYAVIGMLDMGMAFLSTLLAYGVRDAIVRLYHGEKSVDIKQTIVGTGIILIAVATFSVSIPVILFSKPISALLLSNAKYSHLVILAMIAFAIDMVGQGATSWILIKRKSLVFAAMNVLRLFLGLSFNIWLILIKDMGLDGYFISSLATNVLNTAIILVYVKRDSPLVFNKTAGQSIITFMSPLIPGFLVNFFARQAERGLVRVIVNFDSVGILEMAYKFPFLLPQMITTPFMQSWNTKRYEIAESPDAPKQIGKMFTFYLFLIIGASVCMASVIKPVLELLTPPSFWAAYKIARLECLFQILQGAYYHLSFGLLYAKRTSIISKIQAVTSALKLFLAWTFISHMGINGAAYSAVIIAAITLGVTHFYSRKYYQIQIEYWKIAIISITGILVFIFVTQVDLSNSRIFFTIKDSFIPSIIDHTTNTILGQIKNGKIILLLQEKNDTISEIVLKGLMTLSFFLITPVIKGVKFRKLIK